MAKGLSHEEVWDDSALVTSWNEALEEYKKYHSLAVKGENINVVLDRAENGEPGIPQPDVVGNGSAKHAPQVSTPSTTGAAKASATKTATESAAGAEQPSAHPAAPKMAAMPQALMGQVQDESLKNIMMSWYYAGYYTGLYEGQQKAYASMQQGD